MTWIILAIVVFIALLYIFSLRGRTGHKGLTDLRGWAYAHRGLHGEHRPENSMAAFRAALENGYGIELDIHLLSDGNLAVIHDSSLLRTTGQEGMIENLTTEDLTKYFLEGTFETIPTFSQVLELFDGKAPLVVELKSANNNCAALCEATCKLLDGYKGVYCIESFDPRCILWLKKNRPDLIRGQLSRNFLSGKDDLPWILKFLMTHQLINFLTLPDFISYRFGDRKNLGCFLIRKLWNVQGVTWTLKTPQEHQTAVSEGWLPIFENYKP